MVTGCSAGSADTAEGDLGRAALVVAQGGLGDESYNDLALQGFERGLEASGVDGTTIESDDVVGQGEQILRRAGDGGLGLVIDLEYSHAEVLPRVAADYQDTKWVLVNAEAAGDNVASVLFQEQEGSYLAGALAAMHTTSGTDPQTNPEPVIGVIGGTEGAGIDKFLVGFMQGALSVNPDTRVLVAYSNDFGDPTKGQQLAQSMFDQGADIIYAVAGGTGSGVIQAAQAAGHYAIGVDTDQDSLAPGNVLTSMLKKTDVAMETVIAQYADGSFPGGETISLGLAQDGVGLTEFEHTRDAIGEETFTRLAEIEEQIISGEIEVWNVVEQGYPDFWTQR